ncbi:sugar ABC transporter substrate-binding protein [Candidatus Darwinibacter acetoxidans]|nr:sugar ABC transporter substrate-binding protein [Bacillota bacterium]HPT84120.1 sugar ABC transporter substrate-binding protein [Limnochordia bacterium]
MKRASVVLIVLLLLGSFSVSAFGADVKVGFIATNFSAEAQARVAKAFEENVTSKGWDLVKLNSMGSIETQANQLENLVQMEVDAIVMAMGHPAEMKDVVDKVVASGIPLITIDSGYVEGVVADITADNFVMGAKISTYLLDSLGGSGNIIVIKFQKHQGCRRRGKVLDAVLSEYPDIKVIDEYGVVATARFLDDTRSAMETFVLKYGDSIDGVWCAFDQLAYVAGDVLREYGYDDTLIVGVDGNEETFRRIRNGTVTATVAQPFEDMAGKAVEIIDKIVVHGIDPDEAAGSKIIYIDAPLIDITNLPEGF